MLVKFNCDRFNGLLHVQLGLKLWNETLKSEKVVRVILASFSLSPCALLGPNDAVSAVNFSKSLYHFSSIGFHLHLRRAVRNVKTAAKNWQPLGGYSRTRTNC